VSIASILNIAQTALSATQTSLQTTSHNIANANTAGYARQGVVLEEAPSVLTAHGLMGNGVQVKGVIRYYDKYIEKSIAAKNTSLEEDTVDESYFQRIEGTLNENNSNLSQYITDFFNGWQDLSTDPTSVAARESLAADGTNVARSINNIYSDLTGLQVELNNNVGQEVTDANRLIKSIASLNTLIFEGGVGGGQANDSIDQRNEQLKELSAKLDLVSFEDPYGRMTVLTSSGKVLVDGGQSWELATTPDATTGLSRVAWKDASGNLFDISGDIKAGRLRAMLDMRDNQIPGFISNIDDLAQTLIQQVNTIHATGFNLNGTQNDFFKGISGNYAKDIGLSDEVKADSRNISATSVLANTTDNDVALSLAGLADSKVCDGGTTTFTGYEASIVSRIGELTKAATDSVQYDQDTMNILSQQREGVSGVSLDDEMTNLIKFQHAYEASARLFTVADELFQSLLGAVK
jgi:flagellar hook-associated protein 1 FlgK